ncbi:ParB-like protein [Legionella worsleiensis]|uniref:Uncharacterized protein n=1 Tax=Legionella worsleiensis TaxID=45076 RepID=A0A0W1AIT3_9GAMM|nr:ParB-like protein [Legionella worsleiensis]KTD81261.1 hypothetical protein Lwor_0762 [Legionella worsleiensis]STY30875.1 Uncharacterised protein [Legionella worsleiensis]
MRNTKQFLAGLVCYFFLVLPAWALIQDDELVMENTRIAFNEGMPADKALKSTIELEELIQASLNGKTIEVPISMLRPSQLRMSKILVAEKVKKGRDVLQKDVIPVFLMTDTVTVAGETKPIITFRLIDKHHTTLAAIELKAMISRISIKSDYRQEEEPLKIAIAKNEAYLKDLDGNDGKLLNSFSDMVNDDLRYLAAISIKCEKKPDSAESKSVNPYWVKVGTKAPLAPPFIEFRMSNEMRAAGIRFNGNDKLSIVKANEAARKLFARFPKKFMTDDDYQKMHFIEKSPFEGRDLEILTQEDLDLARDWWGEENNTNWRLACSELKR